MTDEPGDTGRDQGGRFRPGVSGNPRGRPTGKSKGAILAERMFDEEAEGVLRAVILAAMRGDMQAARLVIERLAPPARSRRLELPTLPPITGPEDLPRVLAEVVALVADGTLSAEEGAALAGIAEGSRRAHELVDVVQRLERLEAAEQARRPPR